MKTALYIAIALASLLSCSTLTACGKNVEAEQLSIDALSEALGVDVSASMCSSGRKAASITSTSIKMAGISLSPVSYQDNASLPVNQQKIDNAPKSMPSMDHSHIPVAVPSHVIPPRLSATLTRDVMSGYNLKLDIENYKMTAPPIGVPMEELMIPSINADTGFVEGHAHLYINGEKIQRVYGDSVHIPASYFKEGMNQLNITINNHAHMFWTFDDKKIISSLFISVSTPQLMMHQFDSFPVNTK